MQDCLKYSNSSLGALMNQVQVFYFLEESFDHFQQLKEHY